jgi:outer membrane protein TolC
MDLASNIARITKIKYEQGVGSNLEVVDAENSLRTSQTNYYSALFDAMIAKVDLDKAYGKLIPLSSTK